MFCCFEIGSSRISQAAIPLSQHQDAGNINMYLWTTRQGLIILFLVFWQKVVFFFVGFCFLKEDVHN